MKRTIFFIVITCIFSCSTSNNKTNIKEQINYYTDREITIPDTLSFYYKNKKLPIENSMIFSKMPKVISIINGGCSKCVQEIVKWEEFNQILIDKGFHTSLYIIITNISDTFFQKVYYPELPIDFYIIIDENNLFLKHNGLLGLTVSNTIFLNSTNKIKFIGSPLNNNKILNIYKNELFCVKNS